MKSGEGNGDKFVKFDKSSPILKTDHVRLWNIPIRVDYVGSFSYASFKSRVDADIVMLFEILF